MVFLIQNVVIIIFPMSMLAIIEGFAQQVKLFSFKFKIRFYSGETFESAAA